MLTLWLFSVSSFSPLIHSICSFLLHGHLIVFPLSFCVRQSPCAHISLAFSPSIRLSRFLCLSVPLASSKTRSEDARAIRTNKGGKTHIVLIKALWQKQRGETNTRRMEIFEERLLLRREPRKNSSTSITVRSGSAALTKTHPVSGKAKQRITFW